MQFCVGHIAACFMHVPPLWYYMVTKLKMSGIGIVVVGCVVIYSYWTRSVCVVATVKMAARLVTDCLMKSQCLKCVASYESLGEPNAHHEPWWSQIKKVLLADPLDSCYKSYCVYVCVLDVILYFCRQAVLRKCFMCVTLHLCLPQTRMYNK